jgi:hypothetical protein
MMTYTEYTAVWTDDPGTESVVEGRPFFNARETCRNCGYELELHWVGGPCVEDEIDAMRRWGLM